MSSISKVSVVFAVVNLLVAAFWFTLPWRQIAAGVYEGGEAFIVGLFFTSLFGGASIGLFLCFLYTRASKRSRIVEAWLWSFVVVAGLAGFAMASRILWVTFMQ